MPPADGHPQQSGRGAGPNGANTIVPSSFHAAPRPLGASRACDRPPVTAIFLSLPPEKKAIQLPSGEKNGVSAPSVPGRARRGQLGESPEVDLRTFAVAPLRDKCDQRASPVTARSPSPRSKDRKASAPTGHRGDLPEPLAVASCSTATRPPQSRLPPARP